MLFLGRLSRKKGLDLMVEAFTQVAAQAPEAYLLIVGPDEEGWTERIRQSACANNLQGRIKLTGLLLDEERLAAFADADLFALTSFSENFGMSVAEAMAAGLPVLVSDQVGISSAIKRAGAGAVVPLDVRAIADAMADLLRRNDLQAMGELGRHLIRTRFSPDTVAQQMLDAYAEIIGRSGFYHRLQGGT